MLDSIAARDPDTPEPIPFCAQLTRRSGEAIYGTAAGETTVWFLLEYTQAWRNRAVTDNDLPPAVQAWLATQQARIEGGRLLFIKQSARKESDFTFYVALAPEKNPRLYRFRLPRYEDLLDLDTAALVAQDGRYAAQRTDEQLFLVCTNGRRDRCCAKFGYPVFKAMFAYNARPAATGSSAARPQSVWRCTHLGGHRYAPTLAVFPAGLYYGQIAPHFGLELMRRTALDRISLENFRGRTCYTPVVQAADYFLRRTTGQKQIDAFTLVKAERVTAEEWRVYFRETGTTTEHTIRLKAATSQDEVLASCSTPKLKSRPVYRFLYHEINQRSP